MPSRPLSIDYDKVGQHQLKSRRELKVKSEPLRAALKNTAQKLRVLMSIISISLSVAKRL